MSENWKTLTELTSFLKKIAKIHRRDYLNRPESIKENLPKIFLNLLKQKAPDPDEF